MIELNMQTITAVIWGKILLIALFYLLAWVFHRLSSRLATSLIGMSRFRRQTPKMRTERMETLHGLTSSGLTFIGFGLATFFSLLLFVDGDTLIWMIGLFSAAFGLGARPFLSDFLTGIAFLFEDTFDVGEKVELGGTSGNIEGVVEAVNMRTTEIRSPTGELITLPNGEIRLIRNYSRGRFSVADIKIKISAEDVQETIDLLTGMAVEAVTQLPNLLEPWKVISESGEMGQHVELTLVAKARYGKAAEMRPRLLALVQEHMEEAGIQLAG
ncbi:MAG: mechanosensitive ion channel family protein [Anaerolineae bacterium]|nr:mechanosensitive ion channel family protein [Anaerolineae bacterium]